MTEATVLAPFMKKLRELRPEWMVVKHRDASMIGLPDFSVTGAGRVCWCEAKLFNLPKNFVGRLEDLCIELAKKARVDSPTQAETLMKFDRAAAGLYIVFVKKTCVALVNPWCTKVEVFKTKTAAAEWLAECIEQWNVLGKFEL